MSEKKTHWRVYHPSDYIGSVDLIEAGISEMDITIESVEYKEIKGPEGKKDNCVIAKLVGQKPIILNVTNCKMLAKVSGYDFVEDWAGITVTISVEKVHAWGEWVDCLRIKPDLPKVTKTKTPPVKTVPKKTLPELTEDHERYDEAVESLKSGAVTVIGIKKSFSVSKELEEKLDTIVEEILEEGVADKETEEPKEEKPKTGKGTTVDAMTPDTSKVDKPGDEVKEEEPEPDDGLEVLTPKHEKWNGINKAVFKELVSIDSIIKQYSISKKNAELLLIDPDKK